jgi:hypothetical protein
VGEGVRREPPENRHPGDAVPEHRAQATLAVGVLEARTALRRGRPAGKGKAGHDEEPGQRQRRIDLLSRTGKERESGPECRGSEHRVLERPEGHDAPDRLAPRRAGAAEGPVVDLESAGGRGGEERPESCGNDLHRVAEAEAWAVVDSGGLV